MKATSWLEAFDPSPENYRRARPLLAWCGLVLVLPVACATAPASDCSKEAVAEPTEQRTKDLRGDDILVIRQPPRQLGTGNNCASKWVRVYVKPVQDEGGTMDLAVEQTKDMCTSVRTSLTPKCRFVYKEYDSPSEEDNLIGISHDDGPLEDCPVSLRKARPIQAPLSLLAPGLEAHRAQFLAQPFAKTDEKGEFLVCLKDVLPRLKDGAKGWLEAFRKDRESPSADSQDAGVRIYATLFNGRVGSYQNHFKTFPPEFALELEAELARLVEMRASDPASVQTFLRTYGTTTRGRKVSAEIEKKRLAMLERKPATQDDALLTWIAEYVRTLGDDSKEARELIGTFGKLAASRLRESVKKRNLEQAAGVASLANGFKIVLQRHDAAAATELSQLQDQIGEIEQQKAERQARADEETERQEARTRAARRRDKQQEQSVAESAPQRSSVESTVVADPTPGQCEVIASQMDKLKDACQLALDKFFDCADKYKGQKDLENACKLGYSGEQLRYRDRLKALLSLNCPLASKSLGSCR